MGISCSLSQLQELGAFKNRATDSLLGDIDIPEKEENRRPTNVKCLVILGALLVIFLPFVIYTLCYANFARIFDGYDKCGNICGRDNSHWEGIECSGKDLRAYPYLEIESKYTGPTFKHNFRRQERQCVSSCKTDYTLMFGRCVNKLMENDMRSVGNKLFTEPRFHEKDLALYFLSIKWQLIISCLLSVLVSSVMMFLFCHASSLAIWGLLMGWFLASVLLTIAFWSFYLTLPDGGALPLIFGIPLTMLPLILGIVFFMCMSKIRLIILLFKETTKVVFDIPRLVVVPFVCVIAVLSLLFIFNIVLTAMISAGTLKKTWQEFYAYTWNFPMEIAFIYNLFVFIWLFYFLISIQDMVIAGAASKWYFNRDKSLISKPIRQSIGITFKYHLGSVALGALLNIIFPVILLIMGLLKLFKAFNFKKTGGLFTILLTNACIVTAMHGRPLLRSGERAARLIIQYLGDIIVVNYVADFVLLLAKLFIVIVNLLLASRVYSIAPGSVYDSDFMSYIIVAVVSLIVSTVFFGVFKITANTFFICYCEDSLLNDGRVRPYFMTRNLMKFVEETKKVYDEK
ncbi:choline transporter-like protein 1 [Euwallacea fornicatus]|uniref:choline transporter-like protein 1 n=1 Tax=Euwallacea fornicatus TaxID=995702 RepID=UPI00338D59CF